VIALGGSTNAVLHLLAIALRCGRKAHVGMISRASANACRVLADVRPSGRYLMSELIAIGGIQPLMKMLLDAACCTRIVDRHGSDTGQTIWPRQACILLGKTSCGRCPIR